MPELIDKAKLLKYLVAIKPDEYVSAYGEAAVDVINHVETYVNEMPTIEADIDRAAILRLCNEIEMIIVTVCDTGYTLQIGDEEAIMKRTKAIRKELAEDAGSKTD